MLSKPKKVRGDEEEIYYLKSQATKKVNKKTGRKV